MGDKDNNFSINSINSIQIGVDPGSLAFNDNNSVLKSNQSFSSKDKLRGFAERLK